MTAPDVVSDHVLTCTVFPVAVSEPVNVQVKVTHERRDVHDSVTVHVAVSEPVSAVDHEFVVVSSMTGSSITNSSIGISSD